MQWHKPLPRRASASTVRTSRSPPRPCRHCWRKRWSTPGSAELPWRSMVPSSRAPLGRRLSCAPATASRSFAPVRAVEGLLKILDPLNIAGDYVGSALFPDTAGYPNRKLMLDSIAASGTEMVTASIRRISLAGEEESLVDLIPKHIHFLPNTAGCQTAKDAVLTAELAREALETSWIKLEVIGDRELLYPDTEELVRATETLVGKGFIVLPYCTDDPVACRNLADAGAPAGMPPASPIGSGLGICNPHLIELVCARSPVPVVLDAGF